MQITPRARVADIATAYPSTIEVFQRHGIDYCCGGQRPLDEAASAAGVALAALVETLTAAVAAGSSEERDWSEAPLSELVSHILSTYHRSLATELPRLAQMAAQVLEAHGARHASVVPPLVARVEELKAELEFHMMKEEAVLFPSIVAMEAATRAHRKFAGPPPMSLAEPMAVMESEHEHAAQLLDDMRRLTQGYALPADACPTFIGLYHGLENLERALHAHIHLENNVLFPRAADLEHASASSAATSG